ncbi:MAG TPA: flagellar motor protein MotB [Caulobacteraceae bacterium]|jgi:chemotaxis protein MotB|nr:flagellar motor protein MotB [Caulobacteraceae bacterium]
MAVGEAPTIIIKRIKKGGHAGHHGGAWKVAYADFVTAMMAFFLLMWLINTTSPEQKRGIADYFAPASVSPTTSGSGGILGGAAVASSGSMSSGSKDVIQALAPEAPQNVTESGQSQNQSQSGSNGSQDKADDAALNSAAQSIRQAMQQMPELNELSKQIIVDKTPEGLRIQLVDQEGRSMFKEGSAAPNDRAKVLLGAVAAVINKLPNRITIAGHTSASADGVRMMSDWALSSARADAARQLLQSSGVDPDRVYQVAGKASSDPLYPDDPLLPGNRRITITLLREAPVLPPNPGL